MKILKYLAIIVFIIASIVACESDFENIGVDLVDNGVFDADKITYEVTSYTKSVDRSRVENSPETALGVFYDDSFGVFRANIATQISIPTGGVDFGLDPTIDAVILDIPYSATSIRESADTKPKFRLDRIYGDKDIEFNLKVSQLGTFLNTFDPVDPTKIKKYYSNETYNKLTELYNGNFKPNENDTIIYIRRVDFDTLEDGELIEDFDTIKKDNSAPSIKLPLNHNFFNTNFLENTNESNFESQEKFNLFLNGLLFESEGNDGSLMMLNFANVSLNIYYSNNILKDETVTNSDGTIVSENDYNNDGDFLDNDVPVRTKQTMTFSFKKDLSNQLIRTSSFDRDYSGSIVESILDNPNENKKLYIQGAQGSLVTLDVFNNINLDEIRAENWLINEANLVFNIDQDASKVVPTRLFLYKIDDIDDEINQNAQILDIFSEGEVVLDGNLQYEQVNDTLSKPLKYKINVTDYFSEVLKFEDATQPVKFGVKAFHITDLPNRSNPNDTIVSDFSWDPRGVVIYGNDYLESDPDYDKRLKLEIFYTKLNN